jgi:hypothetical protein
MTTETDDLKDELDSYDGTYPESWTPDVGDIITGELVEYSKGHTDYGGFHIAVIEGTWYKDGEEYPGRFSVWLSHTVLIQEFKKHRPEPGEKLGVKRLPDDQEKEYKRYKVKVDRDAPEVPTFEEGPAPRDQQKAAGDKRRTGGEETGDIPF